MLLLQDKSVRFHYEILESFTAGLVLLGWEVKSLKKKTASLKGTWIKIIKEEFFTENFEIRPYSHGNGLMQPLRPKKLLLRKPEIIKIEKMLAERGRSLVLQEIFTEKGLIKAKISVVRGKKKYEKRETLKKRTQERQIRKEFGRV